MSTAEAVRQIRARKLAEASPELFELGDLSAGSPDAAFVRRVNTAMACRKPRMALNVPATLSDAIDAKGVVRKHAELVVFGTWLIDGGKGARSRPGPRPDPAKILKCVAAIIGGIEHAKTRAKHGLAVQRRKDRRHEITKHAVAEHWRRIFDETRKPAHLDSLLRSSALILSDYLRHLESGSASCAGKQVRRSPEIKRALDAIKGRLPSPSSAAPAIFVEPETATPAMPVPFEIPLAYQSDAHAREYRRLPPGKALDARLRYVPRRTPPASSAGTGPADRMGAIKLVPEVAIRRDYRVVALIDKLVILVCIKKRAKQDRVGKLLKSETGATCFAEDIRHTRDLGAAWGVPVRAFDPARMDGAPLAIMIQDPTPELAAGVVATLDRAFGIVRPVELHLVELSVDFYPRPPCTPEEAVRRREVMVGLLQRHHWTLPSRIREPGASTPRYADARQISEKEIKDGEVAPRVDFLFAHRKSSGAVYRIKSDALVSDREIRNRVLTKKPGAQLALNATLAKGDKHMSHHVTIQHKIADRRNPDRKTYVSLPDIDRRARMEVTISGTEALGSHDLHTIDDLGRISFRKLTRDFLRCKLIKIAPLQHILEDAQTQMRTRGVYGMNLRLRALAEERRLAMKKAGESLPRKTQDEALGLDGWQEMNAAIGDALDGLTKRWRK
jgi:hypothetical protein